MASPMMTKYDDTKKQYPDALLFYQVGDFFEMFREDAVIASKVLDLTLTGKDGGEDERIPMCGIPIFAVDNYIPKLVQAGYKVAICEQMAEPTKGQLVDRKVIKVVTAGTLTDQLDEKKNNYILSVAGGSGKFGIVYADITTGDLKLIMAEDQKTLEDSLSRIKPAEILVNADAKQVEYKLSSTRVGLLPKFNEYKPISFQFARAERLIKKQFNVNSLSVFDITEDHKLGVMALGALLDYLDETQKRVLTNINKIVVEKPAEYMYLDTATRRNLELTENMTTKSKKGSILGLFDKTKTNMGARLVREMLTNPVTVSKTINDRLDAIEELMTNAIFKDELTEALKTVFDIERISGKLAYSNITPKDCLNLSGSLKSCKRVKEILLKFVKKDLLVNAVNNIMETDKITSLIDSSISPDAPTNLKDGGYILKGFDSDLDTYRMAKEMGKGILLELEGKLKEETGIRNLKVSYNRVFGYYIEVSKSQVSMVPASWNRRQTTTNGERYISEELKQIEEKILNSQVEALALEEKLYGQIKEYLMKYIPAFQTTSKAIATVDAMITLTNTAIENNYTRPEIDDTVDSIEIIDGRHPVVESLLENASFVPNDTLLDHNENRTMVITGPNMAGKSTYMRQVAVITLLAHIGSFVPARKARIAITDRIFTRIGASDDLAFGQSTFMVEMSEVATILNNATNKSLLILDEIGRGTSTYDGLSIAWAVLEHISSKLNTLTFFATHYHELTILEGKIAGVKNYRVLIKELNDEIVFLHKIARGSANRSFGIEVASIAGLPRSVINRAKEILAVQEANDTKQNISYDQVIKNTKTKQNVNIAEVISVLSDLDMNTITPLVAFSTLQNLCDKVKKQ